MQGSIDGTSGDHILLAPPAVITQDQVSWSVDELASAIHEAEQ
jgi:adenosylmethionine-8-amino-7-oxononanoate aminotransferase